jgi:TonB family protein
VLAIYDNGPDRESLLASNALERLASISYERNDFEKAASLLERSLAVREKLFGKDDLKVAETLWGLANARAAEHRYGVAKPLYVRALILKETKLGASNPDTVDAMKNFACVDTMSRATTKAAPPAQEDEMSATVEKSYCWLGGWKDDCATSSFGKSQGVLNGKALSLPAPPYPPQARMARASGPVIVAVLIDESGRVLKAKEVCCGHPALIPVSIAAAREAKFKPTSINGAPVQVTGMITYNFVAPRR